MCVMKKNRVWKIIFFVLLVFFSSVLIADEQKKNPYETESPISLYKTTYILPFYYTETLDPIYVGLTPDGQKIQHVDFKFQLSFKAPIIKQLFSKKNAVYLAYTQDSYWQAYNDSPFFREN